MKQADQSVGEMSVGLLVSQSVGPASAPASQPVSYVPEDSGEGLTENGEISLGQPRNKGEGEISLEHTFSTRWMGVGLHQHETHGEKLFATVRGIGNFAIPTDS